MSQIRIAIAEDQELIRKSLGIVLGLEPDFEMAGQAENGEEAVRLCEAGAPDIILMDINMPVMDGVEATRIIKERWPQVKVIILTTFQEVDYVLEALNSGAEGYILKAIDPRDLASGIRHVHRGETLIPQELAKAIFSQYKGKAAAGSGSEGFPGGQGQESCSNGGAGNGKPIDYGLSDRELQVLDALSAGLSNRQIAEKLYLSEGTARNYISSIFSKLDVHNRTAAAKKAKEEGLL
ncbi:response regulator transcription factor [Gorillibacterium massiliense]|uniref:response regulator transcription factor n=1 Tax=Gorillibacterium massiliense TaxID=1280390 RepID=UPI0004BB18CD|nr:response regulator transcription factor [Gorillibacterium massiliense]